MIKFRMGRSTHTFADTANAQCSLRLAEQRLREQEQRAQETRDYIARLKAAIQAGEAA